MNYLTVKDLLEYIEKNNVPMNAEIMMDDGLCGVHVKTIISEKIGIVDCLTFCNDMVSFET